METHAKKILYLTFRLLILARYTCMLFWWITALILVIFILVIF